MNNGRDKPVHGEPEQKRIRRDEITFRVIGLSSELIADVQLPPCCSFRDLKHSIHQDSGVPKNEFHLLHGEAKLLSTKKFCNLPPGSTVELTFVRIQPDPDARWAKFLQEQPLLLKGAPLSVRNSRALVEEAIRLDSAAFEFASLVQQNDHSIAFDAVSNDFRNLRHVGSDLAHDPAFTCRVMELLWPQSRPAQFLPSAQSIQCEAFHEAFYEFTRSITPFDVCNRECIYHRLEVRLMHQLIEQNFMALRHCEVESLDDDGFQAVMSAIRNYWKHLAVSGDVDDLDELDFYRRKLKEVVRCWSSTRAIDPDRNLQNNHASVLEAIRLHWQALEG